MTHLPMFHLRSITIVALLCISYSLPAAPGDTVFVAMNGSDVSGAGTAQNPWKTLTFALQQIQADTLSPKMIQLGAGEFSAATTGESFPIRLKSFVTIAAESRSTTIINAAHTSRVFEAENVRHVRLRHLSIQNGKAQGASNALQQGAGLWAKNSHALEIRDCAMRGNQADHNGGGLFISSATQFSLIDSWLENNQALNGAAIYHDSSTATTITGSTIQHNLAKNIGGGIYFDASTSTIQRCRVRWNTAEQSVREGAGGIVLSKTQATIGGALELGNDIHENLSGTRGTQIYALDNDLVSDARFNFFGDLPNSRIIYPANAFLLTNYRIVSFTVALNTRDFFVAQNGSDGNNGTESKPWRTIQYGLSQMFTTDLDTFRVHLKPGNYGPLHNGEKFPVRLKTRISLIGAGSEQTILSGEGSNGAEILRLLNVSDLRIAQMTIRKATAGAIVARGSKDVVLEQLNFEDNSGTRGAGALLVDCSNFIIRNNAFLRNVSSNAGGALALLDEDTEIFQNTFSENKSKLGGAVYCDSMSHGQMDENRFLENEAEFGGALYLLQSTPKIIRNRILRNRANSGGGAIALDGASQPTIGARKNQTNDIYDNTTEGNGSQLLRINPGLVVDGRYNYWGEIPNASLLHPFDQFSAGQYRNLSLQIPSDAIEIFVSPQGNDIASAAEPDSALKTISHALELLFGTTETPVNLTLLPGTYSRTNTGESFPILLESFVTIRGSSPQETILDGAHQDRIVLGQRISEPVLQSLTLQNGQSSSNGGAAFLDSVSNGIVDNVWIVHNQGRHGGGAFVRKSRGTVFQNCRFESNASLRRGGALAVEMDSVRIVESHFLFNEADSAGGGISISNSAHATIENNRIQGNQAIRGGGIAVSNGSTNIFRNEIIDNVATANTGGGGIFVARDALAIIGGSAGNGNDLYGNQSPGGGAILAGSARPDPIDARNNFFGGNPDSARVMPFAAFEVSGFRKASFTIPSGQTTIYLSPQGNDNSRNVTPASPLRTLHRALRLFYTEPGDLITLSLASGTYSTARTGEIFPAKLHSRMRLVGAHADSVTLAGENSRLLEISNVENIQIEGMTLAAGNSNENGGAVWIKNSTGIAISRVTFRTNVSQAFGGAVYGESVTDLDLVRCRFLDNFGVGGGVSLKGGSGEIFDCLFQANRSPSRGSAIYLEDAPFAIGSNRITQNFAQSTELGGAIHIRGNALPSIGGEPGRGNDVFNNTGGSRGRQISRTGSSPVMKAGYNYFAASAPNDQEIYPLAAFDLLPIRQEPLGDNNPPVIAQVTPPFGDPLIIARGDTLLLEVHAIDPDNDALQYQWFVDGRQVSFASSYQFLSVFFSLGEHTARVEVSDGTNLVAAEWKINLVLTAVEDSDVSTPKSFKLNPMFPNPMRQGVKASVIAFELPRPVEVRVVIYDLLGREIRKMSLGMRPTGRYRVDWDGRDDRGFISPNGVYIVQLVAGEFKSARKVTVVR